MTKNFVTDCAHREGMIKYVESNPCSMSELKQYQYVHTGLSANTLQLSLRHINIFLPKYMIRVVWIIIRKDLFTLKSVQYGKVRLPVEVKKRDLQLLMWGIHVILISKQEEWMKMSSSTKRHQMVSFMACCLQRNLIYFSLQMFVEMFQHSPG